MSEPVNRSWEDLLDKYATAAMDAGLCDSTIRVHCEHCRDLMRRTHCGPNNLDPPTLRNWLSRPSWAYHTRQGHRASVQAVLSWAAEWDTSTRICSRTSTPLATGLPSLR